MTIRRSREKEGFAESAVLDLPHGAHFKCKSATVFGPKFAKPKKDEDDDSVEETFWSPRIVGRFIVVDDRTEDGEFDGEEFTDSFDLKLDLDRLEAFGFDEGRLKNNPPKSAFTEKEQEFLLNADNWTIRQGTKPDNYLVAAVGKPWVSGTVEFGTDLMVETEVIAKVKPRTGNKQGSFFEWNTFVSTAPPKKQKKSKLKQAQQEAAPAANGANKEAELTPEDEKQMNEAIP